jgi:hypothetical protein
MQSRVCHQAIALLKYELIASTVLHRYRAMPASRRDLIRIKRSLVSARGNAQDAADRAEDTSEHVLKERLQDIANWLMTEIDFVNARLGAGND